jgi:uncharacterized protein
MKYLTILFFAFAMISACTGSSSNHSKQGADSVLTQSNVNTYDSILAKKLGADDYGMKKYVMAFLKKGPKRDQDSVTIEQIQKGHMANINRLAEEGKLILAGPYMDDFEIRGIFIFNVETIEEAEALTKTDPAIKAGRLSMELHPWYGSAALMLVNENHKKMSKKSF